MKRFATASLKLILRHLVWRDVIMMCDFTRLGIALNIFLYIILIKPLPLLASKGQSRKERERLRHQSNQEERNSDFVKGKSKLTTISKTVIKMSTQKKFKNNKSKINGFNLAIIVTPPIENAELISESGQKHI